jgi:hypothetical protein
MSSLQNVKATRPNITKSYGISKKKEGLMSWEWVEAELTKSRNYWIVSTRPDGKPHVVPVWGVWMDGALYFGGDPNARRSRNIAQNPNVSVHLESGDDVVILEGVAGEVEDATIKRKFGAAAAVKFEMPELGQEPIGTTYQFKPHTAFAWLEKDYPQTATRWKLEALKSLD